jgi:hypothetical protein
MFLNSGIFSVLFHWRAKFRTGLLIMKEKTPDENCAGAGIRNKNCNSRKAINTFLIGLSRNRWRLAGDRGTAT